MDGLGGWTTRELPCYRPFGGRGIGWIAGIVKGCDLEAGIVSPRPGRRGQTRSTYIQTEGSRTGIFSNTPLIRVHYV